MRRNSLCFAILLASSTLAHAQGTALEWMNKGVPAFKDARYAEAADDFEQATLLDPTNKLAFLYLGTSYATQVVPNLATPDNRALADKGIAAFEQVLKLDPANLIALQQEAAIYRNTHRPQQAKALEERVIVIDPTNADAHYTIGVLDWVEAYDNAIEKLTADGLTDNGNGNLKMSPSTCHGLQAANQPLVDDGITHLQRAVELKLNYADAMQYLNLLYRRRADLHCGKPVEAKNDLAMADEWVHKAIIARKQR